MQPNFLRNLIPALKLRANKIMAHKIILAFLLEGYFRRVTNMYLSCIDEHYFYGTVKIAAVLPILAEKSLRAGQKRPWFFFINI